MALSPNKAITNNTLTKETPAVTTLLAADADGYKSSTGISFAFVDGACTINIASGFTAAGLATAEDGQRLLVRSTSGLNDGIYTVVTHTDTVITLGATDVLATETAAAAGTVIVQGVEIFVITPTKGIGKLCILVLEASGAADLTMSVLTGTHWAAKNTDYVDMQNVITVSDTSYVFIETAPFLQANGTILVMLRAAAAELYQTHAPTLGFLELP